MFETKINFLKHSDVPHILGVHATKHAGMIPHSERIPWIDVEILITRGHAMKGYSGIIKDVLCNQPTPSGLRVIVQITSLDPTAPFRRITLDYDHVVEARYSYFGPVNEQPLILPTVLMSSYITLRVPKLNFSCLETIQNRLLGS